MTIEEIKKKAKEVRRDVYLVNAGIILLGLILIIFPTAANELICRVLGIVLTVWGILKVIDYIKISRSEVFGSFSLVKGCALLGIGIYIIIRPDLLVSFIMAACAIILFIGAVLKLQYAMDFARVGSAGKWFQTCGAILMITASVLTLANPLGASQLVPILIGIALVVDGVWDIITMIYLSRFVSNVKKAAKKSGDNEEPKQRFVDAEAVETNNEDE